jgi:hypothetical protein
MVLSTIHQHPEPDLDPRLSLSSRLDEEELDNTLVRQLSDFVHHNKELHRPNLEKSRPLDEPLYVSMFLELKFWRSNHRAQVDFEEGDNRNPACFPHSKKWAITLLACYSTLIAGVCSTSSLFFPSLRSFFSASTSSAYNMGFTSMMVCTFATHKYRGVYSLIQQRDLNCTEFQATVGFIVYTLGFGLVPLVSSSLSEEFGRQPLYIASAIGFTSMYLLIAL